MTRKPYRVFTSKFRTRKHFGTLTAAMCYAQKLDESSSIFFEAADGSTVELCFWHEDQSGEYHYTVNVQ